MEYITASKSSDKKILKHDVLTNEEMWLYDGLSEDNKDIAYREPEASIPIKIKSDDSFNRSFSVHSPQAQNHAARDQQIEQ